MITTPYKQYRMRFIWSGLVWSGLVWSGLVWSGLVWSGLVMFMYMLILRRIALHYYINIESPYYYIIRDIKENWYYFYWCAVSLLCQVYF